MSVLEQISMRRRLPPPAHRRSTRRGAGLSMRHIAEELGVSVTADGQWERGERTPRGRNLAAYVQLLETIRVTTESRYV